jgi:hypothetical protein
MHMNDEYMTSLPHFLTLISLLSIGEVIDCVLVDVLFIHLLQREEELEEVRLICYLEIEQSEPHEQ